ncbi:MAG: protein kinase [bacterium]
MATLKQIDDIQIFAELYKGATTLVYKGFQASLDRVVLLKVLRPEFSVDKTLTRRFQDEAKLIAKIQHPNVVTVFDYGQFQQWTYFATEYVEGYNLHELIQIQRLPFELSWFILFETTKGLKAAHDKEILHKDIKPSNILVSLDGQVKLTDFGMASLKEPESEIKTKEVSGTVAYMTPEHILGKELNKYTDIFSLGATFVEMITGSPAFTGKKDSEYFQAILNEDPTRTLRYRRDLPGQVVNICKKMLKKEPGDRYQTCEELLTDLEALRSVEKFMVNNAVCKRYLENPESYKPQKDLAVADAVEPPAAVKPATPKKYRSSALVVFSFIVIFITGYWGYVKIVTDSEPGESIESVEKTLDSAATVAKLPPQTEPESLPESKPQNSPFESKLRENTGEPQNVPLKPEQRPFQKPELAKNDSTQLKSEIRPSVVSKMGLLNVTCTPWAVVFLNGDSVGTTPLQQALELPVKSYKLTLRNPNFPKYTQVVQVEENQTTNFEFSLWSLVATMKLEVSPWAEVYIDGKYQDTVPPQTEPIIILPGRHILKLKHPVLGEWNKQISVSAGEFLDLKFNLRTLLQN